jgi:hypothetical protein
MHGGEVNERPSMPISIIYEVTMEISALVDYNHASLIVGAN